MRLRDAKTGAPQIPSNPPFAKGDEFDMLYRGIGPARQVTAGDTYLFATAVCNSPSMIPGEGAMYMSPTPKRLLK